MNAPSITLRLAAFFALASSLILLGVGLLIGASVERHFEDDDLDKIIGKLDLARRALAHVDVPEAYDTLPFILDSALVGHRGLVLAIADSNGVPVYASSQAFDPAPLFALAPQVDETPRRKVWQQDGVPYRGVVARTRSGIAAAPDLQVAVALDISHHDDFMAAFRKNLWLAVGFGVLFTAPLGWLAANRGLKPLRTMARAAADISAARLHRRIEPEALPREFHDLAGSLNDMLARLEESFERLSHFSSDIAHELRTPINNLMMQTQVALSRSRTAEEYREVLYSALEEYDRLARMIGDMLYLAKAENGLLVPSREQVDVAVEVAALFEFYDALAEDAGVALSLTGAASVAGDRLMLRRALSNLLANAIRHTTRGETVRIEVAESGDWTTICVANPGIAIEAAQAARLFDRFYRGDPARSHREGEGAGLGLAITRSIILAHGGTIAITSDGGQNRFELTLPRSV